MGNSPDNIPSIVSSVISAPSLLTAITATADVLLLAGNFPITFLLISASCIYEGKTNV